MDYLGNFTNEKVHPLSSIHIRLVQRNGKKHWTVVEGLAHDLDLEKIAKYIRKTLHISGTVLEDGNLQFNGDHRQSIKTFLEKYKVVDEMDPPIKMHGH
jgi:translation initiation factor SUI1